MDPLPPFPFATAQSTSVGFGRWQLRRSSIAHPFTGVNLLGRVPTDLRERVEAYTVLLRDGEAFSHTTAALLWGVQLPRALEDGPLHVVGGQDLRPRGRGVVGHRTDPGRMRVDILGGVPVVSAADAWVQLAPMVGRTTLVAAGDRLVTGLRVEGVRVDPATTVAHLERALRRHTGGRGVKAARDALPLVREGVDSRRETQLRLILIDAGLPEPVIGCAVEVGWRDPAHPDLAYPELKIAFEYEGDGHRTDARRFRLDIARREAMEAVGWRVIRVTIDDLRDPVAFVARVRRILRERARNAGM